MIVLDAAFNDVTYDRDFGCVEATVTLDVKRRGEPVRPVRIRTHVPARGKEPLRERLLRDAVRMAGYAIERRAQHSYDRVA